jgi:circadian clock protein KaiC
VCPPGTSTPSTTAKPQRALTGVPGLDVVTGGGLPRGRATLVAGTSGSGKTVLGLQFLWAGGQAPGEPGVLVTFEEHAKDLFANVAGFGWELAALARDGRLAVVDASAEDDVVEAGTFDFGGLLARIENALRMTGGRRLVIDALDAVFAQFADVNAVRRELARVIRRVRQLGVTTVITAERTEEYGAAARYGIEEFVVDNVILLRNVLEQHRRRRTVEVLKLRGFSHNKGEYPFAIVPDHGIEVIPLSTIESPGIASLDRMSLGNAEVDQMCGGGAYRDSMVLVSGATGTGKSLMGAQFLDAGLRTGERALLFSFEENPRQIIRNAASAGIDLADPSRQGTLRILSRFPERTGLEDLLVAIRSDIEQHAPRRVIIDSLTALEHSAPRPAFRDWLISVVTLLKTHNIGAMIITTPVEIMGSQTVSGAGLSTLSDVIFLLRYVELDGELRRAVAVLKTRGSGHDQSLREFEIHDRGMRLLGPLHGVGAILGGSARLESLADDFSGDR